MIAFFRSAPRFAVAAAALSAAAAAVPTALWSLTTQTPRSLAGSPAAPPGWVSGSVSILAASPRLAQAPNAPFFNGMPRSAFLLGAMQKAAILRATPKQSGAATGVAGNVAGSAGGGVSPTLTTAGPSAAGGGGDAWSGVLFNTSSPFSPGAMAPRPRPGMPGSPGTPGTPAAKLKPAAPVPPLAADEKPTTERVKDLYRRALVLWASGEGEKACGELMALETRVVTDADLRTAKALLKAEEKIIDEVAGDDLEVLVPIARLHFEAYRRYLNEGGTGRALVARHSRIMVHDLALLYRKQSGSEGATLVASHLMTTLGDLLEHGAQHETAAELYTQAAELDKRNPVPSIRLGVIYEKFEQYKSAVTWLRRALAADPANPEIRMRLAVNLARTKETSEAQALFEKVIAEGGDSWAVPLAVQELARLEERKGALGRSAEVLESGIKRFPDSVRLRLQLAAVLDREGKVREGRKAIDEIASLHGDAFEGARFRYNQTGMDSVAVSRGFFEENAASRMRVLAEALERTGAAHAEAAAAPAAPPAEVRP